MKPFNLEEYLKNPSKKVVTRDGRKARIICTDFNNPDSPVIGEIESYLWPSSFTKSGLFIKGYEHPNDLFFAPEKHEGYACVHFNEGIHYLNDTIFSSKEEAYVESKKWADFVAIVKIEWEE